MNLGQWGAEWTKLSHAIQAIPGLLEILIVVFALGFVSTVVAVVFLANRVHRLIDVVEKANRPQGPSQPPNSPHSQQEYLTPFYGQQPPRLTPYGVQKPQGS